MATTINGEIVQFHGIAQGVEASNTACQAVHGNRKHVKNVVGRGTQRIYVTGGRKEIGPTVSGMSNEAQDTNTAGNYTRKMAFIKISS